MSVSMNHTTKRRIGFAGIAISALLMTSHIAFARIRVMLTTVPALNEVASGVLPMIVALDAGCIEIVWPHQFASGNVRWMSSFEDSKRFRFRWFPYITNNRTSGLWQIRIPIWIPTVLVAIPSFVFWRRNRLHLSGRYCKCGYDLTGNESGVCPECGTKI